MYVNQQMECNTCATGIILVPGNPYYLGVIFGFLSYQTIATMGEQIEPDQQ